MLDPTLPPYKHKLRKVAKCTGLGGGDLLKSCETGYFEGQRQALIGLGLLEVGRGGSLEEVRGKKRQRAERERLEKEEWETFANNKGGEEETGGRNKGEENEDEDNGGVSAGDKHPSATRAEEESHALVSELLYKAENEKETSGSIDASSPKTIVEYTSPSGSIHDVIVHADRPLSSSIESFCVKEFQDRDECMQDVKLFFMMYHQNEFGEQK